MMSATEVMASLGASSQTMANVKQPNDSEQGAIGTPGTNAHVEAATVIAAQSLPVVNSSVKTSPRSIGGESEDLREKYDRFYTPR